LNATENTPNDDSRVNCHGIDPFSLFSDRSKLSISLKFAKVAGIDPVKKLFDKLRDLIWLKFPISCGISPDSIFTDKSMPDIKMKKLRPYMYGFPFVVKVNPWRS
jgi:hypothetical protein